MMQAAQDAQRFATTREQRETEEANVLANLEHDVAKAKGKPFPYLAALFTAAAERLTQMGADHHFTPMTPVGTFCTSCGTRINDGSTIRPCPMGCAA